MLILLALLMQDPAQPASATPPLAPLSIERVNREMDRRPLKIDLTGGQQPTFRVEIRERFTLADAWTPDPFASSDMRTNLSRTHYEFLAMVTPEEFRSATLHPCCGDLLAASRFLHKHIANAIRDYRVARIRRQIAEELEELERRAQR